jgi:hypothetical protein
MHHRTSSVKINKIIKEVMIFYLGNTQGIPLPKNDNDFKTVTILTVTSKIIHPSVRFITAIHTI